MSSPPKKVPIHLHSSQNRLLIKNGRIVNDDSIFDADIYIENGIIAQVGTNLVIPGGVRIIDARATSPNEVNYILPGGIDTHTHLQTQFMNAQTVDDYYNGTRAAIAGGTTTIMNFAFTSKQSPSLLEAFERERKLADEQVCCDFALHIGVSEWIENRTEQEIAKLVNEYGVNSFKIFLCYSMQLNDKQIVKVLQACAKYGAIVVAHCENGDIIEFNTNKLASQGLTGPEAHLLSRPECVEAEATHRMSVLAEQVGCPLMVAHVMSRSAAQVIVEERARNSSLFGETLAASIGTDGSHYYNKCWRHAAAHVMSPPLRVDKSTPDFLFGALASGSLQVLGSDHCVFNAKQKSLGADDFRKIPNGVNGIEERMLIAWEKGVRGGYLDPCKFVAITSTNAAKLFNLYPRKGRIQVGSDADLVIWGRNVKVIKAENQISKGDFNIFEGTRLESGPLVVVAQGRVVLDQAGLHVVQGGGRYLARQPFPITAYGPLRIKSRLIPASVDRSAGDEAGGDVAIEGKIADRNVTIGAGHRSAASPRPDWVAGTDDAEGFHSRIAKTGNKNMQDSTFKLSGAQIDDHQVAIEGKAADRNVLVGAGHKSAASARPDWIAGTDDAEGFHSRIAKTGNKNMQDSTFKLSGAQIDDHQVAIEGKMADLNVTVGAGHRSAASPGPETLAGTNDAEGFYSRACKNGVKNMQDSTFKLSGAQIDDKQSRSNIRVSGQPPGGRSNGLW